MIIEAIELNNFRQFYGEQRMEFARDEEKNVTVIHGFNGSGKTALLNAFVWCLYGEVTPDLDAPDKMVNERAISAVGRDGKTEFEVALHYRLADGTRYLARRTATATLSEGRHRETKGELVLYSTGSDGERVKLKGAQTHVDSQLPKQLVPFFFFNGERVERLAHPDAYSEVEDGIKTLLSVEVFERGVEHLRQHAVKKLQKDLAEHGSDDLKDKLAEKEQVEISRDILNTDYQQHTANIANCETAIERIEAKQEGMLALTRLIERQRAARDGREAVKDGLKTCEQDLAETLSKEGFLAFGSDVIARTKALVADATTRGELPAKVKPQFVDDLLEDKMCICGRAIEPGSPAEQELQSWRSATGLAALEEAVAITSGATGSLTLRRNEYFDRITSLRNRQSDLKRKMRGFDDELDEIKQQIGDRSTDEEAADLRDSKARLEESRRQEERLLERCEESLKQANLHIAALEKTIEKLQVQGEKGEKLQRQLTSARNVANALDEIAELQKQDVRRSLDHQISEIWDDAAVKDYKASVSEGFRLELFKRIRGSEVKVYGASTGEKQVLALSFVGALVKKARQNAERNTDSSKLVTGGSYPLIMDSPFGSLEQDYQQKIAEWIPSLAGQVVVMASKSQWTPQVEKAMRPKVGREYVLELHTPKEGADQEIEINGRSYAFVKSTSDDFEQTLFQETV